MSEKYVVTWDMLQIHARKLAARLMPSEQWKRKKTVTCDALNTEEA